MAVTLNNVRATEVALSVKSLRFASGNNKSSISTQNPTADDSEKKLVVELESPGVFRNG